MSRRVPLVGSLEQHSGLCVHESDAKRQSPAVPARLHPAGEILVGEVQKVLAKAAYPVLRDAAPNPEGLADQRRKALHDRGSGQGRRYDVGIADEAARGRLRQFRIVPVRNDGYLRHQFPQGVGEAIGQLERIPQGGSYERVYLAGGVGRRKILDDPVGKGIAERGMTNVIVRKPGIDGPRGLVPGSVAGWNRHPRVDLISSFQPRSLPIPTEENTFGQRMAKVSGT